MHLRAQIAHHVVRLKTLRSELRSRQILSLVYELYELDRLWRLRMTDLITAIQKFQVSMAQQLSYAAIRIEHLEAKAEPKASRKRKG